MRALILGLGTFLASGFAVLGVLVAMMDEGRAPIRRGSVFIEGPAAYSMALAWIALAVSIFCLALLMADVGAKYYVRTVRDWAFFAFAIGFIVALGMAIHKVYGPIAF